eukprot:83389-Rhodomonas_salina.1
MSPLDTKTRSHNNGFDDPSQPVPPFRAKIYTRCGVRNSARRQTRPLLTSSVPVSYTHLRAHETEADR